jgi:hypothetical protein
MCFLTTLRHITIDLGGLPNETEIQIGHKGFTPAKIPHHSLILPNLIAPKVFKTQQNQISKEVIKIPLSWIAFIIVGAAFLIGDRIMNMLIVQEQVVGFVNLVGILAALVLALLTLLYFKERNGGEKKKDE